MRVLITGGTGSLGSLLVGAFTARGDIVTILSRDGHKQAALLAEYPHVRALLGDICDTDTVWRAVKGQNVVIHAAALKRIERGQTDPWEYLRVNTLGSKNVIDQVVRAQVDKCILISTDKVSAPTNFYGITKRAAEYLWLSYKTCNAVIRYGNVMDSAGSVWWHWQRLLKMGLPLSVREPAPTRFFLLRKQAVALVLDALEHMQGGEIFIPRDIAAVDLHDLARALQPESRWIREPLLPGEKQHEVLAAPDEFVIDYTPKLWVIKQGENQNPTLNASVVSHCSETARRLSGMDVVAQLQQIE